MGKMRVTEISIGGPDVHMRGASKVIKGALRSAIMLWHRRFAPLHFKRIAFRRYGYEERSKKYEERKKRRYGHKNPNVLTGAMRDQVLRRIDIRGTAKSMKGHMRGPRYLWQFNKQIGAPDKAAEITKTTPHELRVMGKKIDEQSTLGFNRLKARRTRRL